MLSKEFHSKKKKKVGTERFKSLLWFDLSLHPKLIHYQKGILLFLITERSFKTLGRTVAFVISSSQIDHDQFMGLLGRLKSSTQKDLGQMALIMNDEDHWAHGVCLCQGRALGPLTACTLNAEELEEKSPIPTYVLVSKYITNSLN